LRLSLESTRTFVQMLQEVTAGGWNCKAGEEPRFVLVPVFLLIEYWYGVSHSKHSPPHCHECARRCLYMRCYQQTCSLRFWAPGHCSHDLHGIPTSTPRWRITYSKEHHNTSDQMRNLRFRRAVLLPSQDPCSFERCLLRNDPALSGERRTEVASSDPVVESLTTIFLSITRTIYSTSATPTALSQISARPNGQMAK